MTNGPNIDQAFPEGETHQDEFSNSVAARSSRFDFDKIRIRPVPMIFSVRLEMWLAL